MTQKKFTINVTAHYCGTLTVAAASESEATDKANALLREGKMPMFEFGDILSLDDPEEAIIEERTQHALETDYPLPKG